VLAEELRQRIDELEDHEFGEAQGPDIADFGFEKGLLDLVHRAADVLKAVDVGIKRFPHIVSGVDIAAEVAGWYLDRREADSLLKAKAAIRQHFLAESETLRERWDDYTDQVRDSTSRRLLKEAEQREDETMGRLVNTQTQLAALRDARRSVDKYVERAVGHGYIDPSDDGAPG
jgi:hypothetical protein